MKKKKLSANLAVSVILLLLFAVFVGGVMIWEGSRPEQTLPTETLPPESSAAVVPQQTQPTETLPPETTLPAYETRRINFLLVGRDAHGEGENGRSDAMILCSVDTDKKTITLTSFLRDIYLKIPGHGSNRLNAAYSWGGRELLMETLRENFGVEADVSLEIDFEGFSAMIDALGGVQIELTQREADHMSGSNGWSLSEGINHLDGAQALSYSRIRYLDSDFGRTERQRNVLTALLEKYRGASFEQMLAATDAFLDESTGDHTDEELLEFALELYTMMDGFEIITHRVPADGTYTYETIRGMSVIKVDFEKNRELLDSLLR